MSIRMGAAFKEAPQVQKLRAEVKAKGVKVGALKEKARELRELALSESTTTKAFEAFRAGPESFKKTDKREIVPDIASGKIANAKSSLYANGEPTTLDGLSAITKSETSPSEVGGGAEGVLETVNGVEVATVEEVEMVVTEEIPEGEAAADIISETVETVEQPQEDQPQGDSKTYALTENDKGDVSGLLAKFKGLEAQSVEVSKTAKAEERRREEGKKAQQVAAEKREREEKLKHFEEMRKKKESLLKEQLPEPTPSDFHKRWPYGEPHKQDQLIRYLTELSEDLDTQKEALEVEIEKLEAIVGSGA